jgi:hypothetical protein
MTDRSAHASTWILNRRDVFSLWSSELQIGFEAFNTLALRQYESLVELLDNELGSSPAPETSAIYEGLRRVGPEF